MYTIPKTIKRSLRHVAAAAFACCLLSSCDSVIYDDEGDCAVKLQVTFKYDRNMKWADAFPVEVTSVHLYAFDKDGTLAWYNSESGASLTQPGYAMGLDLTPGDYTLVAWCGLDNEAYNGRSFSVPEVTVGTTTLQQLTCRLNRETGADGAESNGRLAPLFHGRTNITIPDADDGETFTYPISLTKNTNHIRVILQHLNGSPTDVNMFKFFVREENGFMAYDNSLLPDELITYNTYHTGSGTVNMGLEDYPRPGEKVAQPRATIESISVAVADISVPRLMADRKSYLYIYTADVDNRLVARVPVSDYALMLKDGYEHEMSDQDYLDREDEYALTFFLDDDNYWMSSSIVINSWRLILNDIDFGSK